METKVKKWGNSLAVRIPKPLAAQVGLDQGSPIEFSLSEGSLIITPVVEPVYELEELLAEVTEGNLHNEVDLGDPMGIEAW